MILNSFNVILRVLLPRRAIIIIVEAEEAIRPIEVERRPFKIFEISSTLLCFLKKLNKKYPISEERLTAIAPGEDWQRQPYLVTPR